MSDDSTKRTVSDGLWRDERGIWHIETSVAGERIRCSAFTEDRKEAEELRDTLKARAWRVQRLGERPQYTWDEAVVAWVAYAEGQRLRSLENTRDKLRWFQPHLGGMKLTDVSADVVKRVLALRSAEPWVSLKGKAKPRLLAPATLNRYWAALSGVLHYVRRMGWIDAAPAWKKLPEDNERIRWLPPAEWSKLYAQLPEQPTGRMAAFALATGLRQHNVTHLKKAWVNLDAKVIRFPASEIKNKRPFTCVLSAGAVAILRQQYADMKDDEPWQKGDWMFTWRGVVIDNPHNTAWHKACERVGIEDFHWHDLRHTWATWHVMSGTPLHVLKELGGWRDMKMVLRYGHIADEYLMEHADNAASYADRPIPAMQRETVDAQAIENVGVADGTRTHNTWNHNPVG